MCGIAGIFSFRSESPDRASLAAMIAALHHRGPDGSSVYTDGRVGLAHARLAIIDVASGKTISTLMLGPSPTGVGAAGAR